MFLKNKNFIFKIRRSKVTDYAALTIKALLSDTIFTLKCFTSNISKMYKSAHACLCNKKLYGCAYVREITHSLKLLDYLAIHTHKPYYNLHM